MMYDVVTSDYSILAFQNIARFEILTINDNRANWYSMGRLKLKKFIFTYLCEVHGNSNNVLNKVEAYDP